MLESERGSMGADQESMSTSLKPLGYFDRGSRSWKTWQQSARGDSPLSPKTWPKSGMISNGQLFELPMWGGRISVPDGSDSRHLPTPTARDWKSGASNLHGKNSRPLGEVVLVLKTPTAQLGRNGAAQHPEKRRGGGHGPTLDDEVSYLLPYSDSIGRNGWSGDESEQEGWDEPANCRHSPAEWWGDYLPAIRRWEVVTGRQAPEPTEVGPRGGRRLTARFAEWLMGLEDGWVTDVPDLKRSDQLHKIGNGVVPRQAEAALRFLLSI